MSDRITTVVHAIIEWRAGFTAKYAVGTRTKR